MSNLSSFNRVHAESSTSSYQAQASEVSRLNATIASVVQLKADTRCDNTSKAYNIRQQKFLVSSANIK